MYVWYRCGDTAKRDTQKRLLQPEVGKRSKCAGTRTVAVENAKSIEHSFLHRRRDTPCLVPVEFILVGAIPGQNRATMRRSFPTFYEKITETYITNIMNFSPLVKW